jgi:hypothetical protein
VKRLRYLLLAVLLLLAQSGALTHALDHLRPDAGDPPSHSCALCIAAQGLDVPLGFVAPDFAFSAANFAPPMGVSVAVPFASAVSPRARAPPIA